MNRERRQLSWRSRSFVYRLGLRPGSVRLRSWAPDVHYRAFSSWANSRGRAPPPRRVTLKCARFAGSSKLRATQKKNLPYSKALLFSLLEILCSVHQLLMLRSRLRVAKLQYLFDLSASRSLPVSFSRLPLWACRVRPLRPHSLFLIGIQVRYYYSASSSSSICTTQNSV